MSEYESPPADKMESVVTSENTDQPSGEEDTSTEDNNGTSTEEETNEGGTNSDNGTESESDSDEDGSADEDSDGEDADSDDDASKSAFTHGEKDYTAEELGKIIDERSNNANWEKSNTEKSQALGAEKQSIATQADKIKGILPILEKVVGDADALEDLQTLTGIKLDQKVLDEIKEVAGLGTPDGQPNELDIAKTELDLLRFQLSVDEFRNNYRAFEEFINYAAKEGAPSIDQAYKLWSAKGADERVKAAEAKAKEAEERADAAEKGSGKPKPPPRSRGAQKITKKFEPSKDGTYEGARKIAEGRMGSIVS